MEILGILAVLLVIGFFIGVVRRVMSLVYGIIGLFLIIGCIAMLANVN